MIFIKENGLLLIKNDEYEKEIVNVKDNNFNRLMDIYKIAMDSVSARINAINNDYQEMFGEKLVDHIMCRIKSPNSIIDKMKRKNYELTYKELVDKINDIAGIRIVCSFKDDIYEILEIIRKYDDWRIIKEKDYITTPKKSGYMSYHVILEVPVFFENVQLYTKVEIQIRSMAMDFWAALEHELQYKNVSKNKISKDLVNYSKIISKIDDKLAKLSNRKYKNKLELN